MNDKAVCPREEFETWHGQWLAPQALREAHCGGRAYDEPPHPYRTCYQRDRDRIIHCAAFRRLDFKTQVFVPHEQDHFRTRMTHTLEVAQIARSLGRALRLNEDLIEAVALAHDLGHPPFGHCGESILDGLMAGHGHFEHNRQSLRVVDYLEHPYPHFRGLNLTRAVRQCIAMHRSRYDAPLEGEFDLSLQAPLEGQLVDISDEIAYTSADLEDSLAAGWISERDISALDLWQTAWQIAQSDAPDARPIHQRIRACKAVLAAMTDDVVATSGANLRTGLARTPDEVVHGDRPLVGFSDPMAAAVRQMQEFLLHKVYLSPRTGPKDAAARKAITDLFNAYLADDGLLPDRYRRRVEADGLHRTICDYIAGMTDRFCKQEHERITGTGQ